MKEVIPNKKYVNSFLNSLRKQDKEELDAQDYSKFVYELNKLCLKPTKYTYFLSSKNNLPLAMGGAFETEVPHVAKVWLLSTNQHVYEKKALFKFIINKIEFFKTEFDVLYNFIYKSNFDSLIWLKNCGFKVAELSTTNDYKLFYYIRKDLVFDIRYFTC